MELLQIQAVIWQLTPIHEGLITMNKEAAVKESKKAAEKHDAETFTNQDANKGVTRHNFDEAEKTPHAFVRSTTEKNTGKETSHIGAPEVAMHATGGDSAQKLDNSWRTQQNKTIIVDGAVAPPNENVNIVDPREHPILNLKRDQGMFIPNRPGLTTDDLMHQLNKELYSLRSYGAQVEKDVNGDDILETIIVEEKKRNDDGTIQLAGGKPVVGANQQNRPKLIHTCNFTVHAVVKDADIGSGKLAPEDGVLVIRVS